MTEIQEILYAHSDPKYAAFSAKLIPNVAKEKFIGVRAPEYKMVIKELEGNPSVEEFLGTLPHAYYDENVLHAALLCRIRDFDECLRKVEQFLPYVDNWAVNDGLNPKVFRKHHAELREKIPEWLSSEAPFIKRFGMHILMSHFLDEDFDPSLLELPARIRSGEYYVNMMTAWLFAEALVKQWESTIPYIENRRLDKWTHNKAIQKAIESYRITDEQKDYLRSLKVK